MALTGYRPACECSHRPSRSLSGHLEKQNPRRMTNSPLRQTAAFFHIARRQRIHLLKRVDLYPVNKGAF